MPNIIICPYCLQGYADVTLRFCLEDGSRLSVEVELPPSYDESEIETVIRPTPKKPKKKKTDPKAFLETHFPELLQYRRRASRLWLHSEKPEYHDNWWFSFMADELESTEYFVFVGALDKENQNFKVFKVPTAFLKANLSKMSKTGEGWVNLYIHIEDFNDLRKSAGLSLGKFAVN